MTQRSNLEDFVRDYVEAIDGVWDEVEPEVYDLLLPPGAAGAAAEGRGVVRVAFDPEALPEHPRAQLASFGTPLVDALLHDALRRGGHVELCMVGFNLAPHNLAARVIRGLTLPDGGLLAVDRVRRLHFRQIVFWFEATFVSDQKEQEIVPLAIDLHYGRQVRHLDALLDPARLSRRPAVPLADAADIGRAAGYRLAREQVVRTLTGLANSRSRELGERLEKQTARLTAYYAQMERELDDARQRAQGRGDDAAKFVARRDALARERQQRIAELAQKCALRVQVRLLNLVVLRQPKLVLSSHVTLGGGPPMSLELVWDPLIEALEAVPCSTCSRPTFELRRDGRQRLACPACASAAPARSAKR